MIDQVSQKQKETVLPGKFPAEPFFYDYIPLYGQLTRLSRNVRASLTPPAERKLSECRDEIDTMEQMANKAVEENRESDAKDYLRKKLTLEESLPELEKAAEAARENYRSITENVENLKLELEEIKAM